MNYKIQKRPLILQKRTGLLFTVCLDDKIGKELIYGVGFYQVVVCPAVQTDNPVIYGAQRSCQDDRNIDVILADGA
mgnify:CR=1 FL=1